MLTLKAKYQVGDYVAVKEKERIIFVEVISMTWNTTTSFVYELYFHDGLAHPYIESDIIGRLNPSAVAKFLVKPEPEPAPVVEEQPKKRGRKPKVAITMDTEPEQAEIPADAPD